MNILFNPNSLTSFFKVPQYEIFCLNEEYETNGVISTKKTEVTDEDSEIYEELLGYGNSLLLEDEDGDVYYKENLPKFLRINEKDVEKVGFNNENEFYSTYNPLEDAPNLYTELAKVEYFDIPSLKKFVDNFGLPQGNDLFSTDIYKVFNYEMDLFAFYKALSIFKKALGVFSALRLNDESKIKEYAEQFERYVGKEFNRGLNESTEKILAFKKDEIEKELENEVDIRKRLAHHHNHFRAVKDNIKNLPQIVTRWYEIGFDPPEVRSRHYLVELLNNWEKGNSTYAIIDGQIQPGMTFADLFEVAYFQLSRAVIGNIKMERCEHCGALFEVTHESRRFCPPLPRNKISTCQNSYNQKIKRKRKKTKELVANGLSIEEIAKKLKIDIKEAQAYLND
ncbi:hypothetical protein [Neobacillus jeddahensis]|uniref:hypothetical protein n=1 Tax=Neobacillus jeddahensis TaxID=1461580 RepID=UPI0005A6EB16|nr:hypothetical protein [Neobacillus jeddahensis]